MGSGDSCGVFILKFYYALEPSSLLHITYERTSLPSFRTIKASNKVTPNMEIHENNPDHLNAFIELNESWITDHFELEDADKSLADDPAAIYKNNGYVFSIVEDNTVVGVCALFNEGNGVFEVARMAVSKHHQGKGYGKALINKCISKANELHAKKLYLVSNTVLDAAINLYRKSGFVTTATGQHPVYSRANIVLEYRDR